MILNNLVLSVTLLAVCPFAKADDSIATNYVGAVQSNHKLWNENCILRERLRQLGELTGGKPIETMLPVGTMLEGFVTILIDGAARPQKVTGEIIKSEGEFASILVSLEDGTEVCYDYHVDGRDHLLLRYFATRKSPPPGQQSTLPSRGMFVGNGEISEDGETLTLSTDYMVYGRTHWARFQLKKN